MQIWYTLLIRHAGTRQFCTSKLDTNASKTEMDKNKKERKKNEHQHYDFQLSTVWKAQNEAADWRSPTVDICTLPPSFGTWPPSPYGHHSPVGHSFGLCHPSIVLDPLSAFAIPSSNPYGCSLASASIEDWFGTLCQDLSSPLGMIKSWSKIGHMTNSHCWFLWR